MILIFCFVKTKVFQVIEVLRSYKITGFQFVAVLKDNFDAMQNILEVISKGLITFSESKESIFSPNGTNLISLSLLTYLRNSSMLSTMVRKKFSIKF